jgi:hypothetical protein
VYELWKAAGTMPRKPRERLAPAGALPHAIARHRVRFSARQIARAIALTVAVSSALLGAIPAVQAAKSAEPDTVAASINTAVAFDVLTNDPRGTTLVDHTRPAHGRLERHEGGKFTYLPDANYLGADSFAYRAQHGTGEVQTVDVSIEVSGRVTSVVSRDDMLATDEDIAALVYVLANDGRGPDAFPLSVTIDQKPGNGTAEVQPDNSILYTPAANWSGTDTFTYVATDGSTSDTATVSVEVAPVNEPPTATDDAAVTRQDGSASIDVLANDSDADGDAFGFVSNTQPMYGTATWSSVDHMIIYTPPDGFWGTDQFTYTIGDFDGIATATVTVTVNGAPAPQADVAVTDQGIPVDISVLLNDTDPDSDALSVTSVGAAAHGEALINPDASIRYVPKPDFTGQDTFTYTVRDQRGNARDATVTVTVAQGTVQASGAADDEYLIIEDSPGNTLDVLSNDTLPGGTTPAISIDTTPAHGTLTLDAAQNITYVPEPGFSGRDSFTYSISDGVNPRSTATVSLEIQPANDAPVALPDTATGDEDAEITIAPLTNDTDEEGDDLTVGSVTQPANGVASIRRDRTVVYVPNADFAGIDAFDYVASDGNGGTATATITITVNPVNDAPKAVGDKIRTDIGVPAVIDVLANDHDPDGPQTLLSITTQPEHGSAIVTAFNTISYTPAPKFEGYDTIEYQLSDGLASATATVNITVGNPNSAPVAKDDEAATTQGESVTIAVLKNDKDRDGDDMTLYGLTNPTHGTITVEKSTVIYTPDPDFVGTDTFTYKVRDGKGGRDKAEVRITVNPVHDRRAND